MTRGIYVTGTDTEVGKTIVTRAIVRALVRRGLRVAALKPVESGAPEINGELVPEDAVALIESARSGAGVGDVCCYRFSDPVSPHLAAARVGATIEAPPIRALLERGGRDSDLVIAEGAGGLLVPLSDTLLYGDLIAATGYALLIVAPNVLGTINATLQTIEAARRRHIDVLGVVLNRTPPTELGNAEAIARHGRVRILGALPTVEPPDTDALADAAERALELESLLG
jgi:dethiobiotin synthetase